MIQSSIVITCESGRQYAVPALAIFGDFAVHQGFGSDDHQTVITYVPTGLSVACRDCPHEAQRLAQKADQIAPTGSMIHPTLERFKALGEVFGWHNPQ